MQQERVMRRLWALPVVRNLGVRRGIWEASNRVGGETVLGDRYELVDRLSPMDVLYRRREAAAD